MSIKRDRPRCRIVEVAKELVSRVEARELPPDFDPGDLWYRQILAWIRHEYTNYEELLDALPLCVDHWERGGECEWDLETGEECHLAQQAHDMLKWAATDAAKRAYQRWLEQREKRASDRGNCQELEGKRDRPHIPRDARNLSKIAFGGARGRITAPAWAWELAGWLLILAIVVTIVKLLLERAFW